MQSEPESKTQTLIKSAPRLLFIIPEVFLGSAGAMILIFSRLGITTLIRRKKT